MRQMDKREIRKEKSLTKIESLFWHLSYSSYPYYTLTETFSYPSGRMAVCVAKNLAGEGKYTYVYDDDDEDSLIAYFTPSSAFCYDKERKQYVCLEYTWLTKISHAISHMEVIFLT